MTLKILPIKNKTMHSLPFFFNAIFGREIECGTREGTENIVLLLLISLSICTLISYILQHKRDQRSIICL